MLPAQAAAKWPPCLLGGGHLDGARRTLNIVAPFHRTLPPELGTFRYWTPRSGCVAYSRFQPRQKAQRSHVTLIRATILLTFFGGEGGRWEAAGLARGCALLEAAARGRRVARRD